MAQVRGFLHVCCLGDYREVAWEIVHALLESRLYDRSAVIDVGLLGAPEDQRVIEEMLAPFDRFRIAFRSTDIGQYEYPTLGLLQDACRTWDEPVYYLHTKGVSYSATNQYARYWRRLMLDHVVTDHQSCVAALAATDTVGVNWSGDHYSGNFWWARSSHIRRLPDIRELQRNPRQISVEEQVDGHAATGRGRGPVWNARLQCEHWLHMEPGRVGIVGPRETLHLYRELFWSTSAGEVVSDLITATGGRRVVEVSDDAASAPPGGDYNASAPPGGDYNASSPPGGDYNASSPPGGDYDVIVVDIRRRPGHALAMIERCLPKLSRDGAIVVRHSNPPSAWHQRPAEEAGADPEWTGQVWRAVVEFRIRHPRCEVFTVDTDWGCTVIRPGRPARRALDLHGADALDWADFARRRAELLNIVDVAWYRRYLHAEPYLAGTTRPSAGTDLINVLISASGLDSYLRVGAGVGEDPTDVIAPVRHDHPTAAGHYDLICAGPDDLESALTLVSANGFVVTRGQPPARSDDLDSEFSCWTVDLEQEYTVIGRRTGAADRSGGLRAILCTAREDTAPPDTVELATQSYAGNRDLLLAAVDLDPDDLRSVLQLGHASSVAGDAAATRAWYTRALDLRDWWWSGFDESMYVAMMRVAEAMATLGEPWSEVRDAYLRAWEFRPDRVAPLYAVAVRYRLDRRFRLGYLYARAGADIPPPAADATPRVTAYHWRIRDELAVCASWTGRRAEAFTLWRELLSRPDLPDADRTRIAGNRDSCVPTMLEAAAAYPGPVVGSLPTPTADPRLTVTVVLGPFRGPAELTLNSFLTCCLDITRAGRFLAVDAGLSDADRAFLQQRYSFLEFTGVTAPGPDGFDDLRGLIDTPLWLHLGSGWRFFAPENLLTRMQAVLAAEPQVVAVGVNLRDAAVLSGDSPAERAVRRAPGAGRYVLTQDCATPLSGPALYDTARYDTARLDRVDSGTGGAAIATLDEVLCIQQSLVTVIGRGNSGTRAIARTLMRSGVFMGEPIKEDSADLIPAEDMYEACRIIARHIPWRGGLDWDFGPVQTMPIPAEFTGLIERYLHSVLASPAEHAGWKLPETTLCYPWIRRLFPDAHYIFWVRNPLDCMTNHHFTDDLRDFGIGYPPTDDPYLRRAISWKYQDDLVAATPRPRNAITVRLEDFIRHQQRELGRLENFLGVDLERIAVRDEPIDRHRRTAGIPFPDFLKPAMRRYGYPT